MYKQLYGTHILESQFGKDVYFTLHDITDFVTTDEYIDNVDTNYWSHKLPQYNKTYKNNLVNLVSFENDNEKWIANANTPRIKHKRFVPSGPNKTPRTPCGVTLLAEKGRPKYRKQPK